jgi:hypothetical protein
VIYGKKDTLKLGEHNAYCDVCGFKFKASDLRDRWDGYKVCELDWETRHPQDFVRGVEKYDAPTDVNSQDGSENA